ncbi:MAG: methylated-DNA--[protein]-cysteine S-methyltransferase [Prevotella sp.]|nr:methylated-DNA--[protein]-cysteine S-methyltransferase [Prevotella sp.]
MARINLIQLKVDVYDIVSQIPCGRVLTYGDIARLAGCPNCSRLVGRLLSCVPTSLRLPCHRVVNASGRIAPHWPEQRSLLEAEDVIVNCIAPGKAKVNLKTYRWRVFSGE